MGNREEVLAFLNKIAPKSASNAEIVSHTHIRPHQQVFQITRRLMKEGRIKGRQVGREWVFSSANGQDRDAADSPRPAAEPKQTTALNPTGPAAFEALCRKVLSDAFGTAMQPGRVDGVPKQFDLVSEDGRIVGDAKYYTAVNGTGLPPAKFATIAEYVWLLEKTRAEKKFLVFGNDRRVPEWWLDRYGKLAFVEFYYLSANEVLEKLN